MTDVLLLAGSNDVKSVKCGGKLKYSLFFQGDPGDIGFPGKKGERVKLFFQ